MRIKIIGIMLSIALIMSTLSGCGAKESDSSNSSSASENLGRSEAESDFIEKVD